MSSTQFPIFKRRFVGMSDFLWVTTTDDRNMIYLCIDCVAALLCDLRSHKGHGFISLPTVRRTCLRELLSNKTQQAESYPRSDFCQHLFILG
jgi:hypothetical protein